MLKEQLHRSFDSIAPSPELLNRVSAMMHEEAEKKKPPIYMNAVKYGGIAAAVAIAAGGAFIALNSSGGIDTAPVTTAATEAAAEETLAEMYELPDTQPAPKETSAPEKNADAGQEPAVAAVTTTAAGPENADEPQDDAYYDEGVQVTTAQGQEAAPETTAAPADDDYLLPELYADGGDDDDGGSAGDIEQAVDDIAGEKPEEEPAAPRTAVTAKAPEEDVAGGGRVTTGFPMVQEYIVPDEDEAAPDDEPADDVYYPADVSDAADGFENVTDDVPEPDADDAMLSAAAAEVSDYYCYPFEPYISGIPYFICELRDYSGWDKFGVRTADIDSIGSYANLYTFINDFGITREEFDKALEEAGADREYSSIADILYSGDTAAMTSAFATPLAIVKGSKAYSPEWLSEHSFEDYEKAGITAEDVLAVYQGCVDSPLLSDEEKAAFREKLGEFLARNGMVPQTDE